MTGQDITSKMQEMWGELNPGMEKGLKTWGDLYIPVSEEYQIRN